MHFAIIAPTASGKTALALALARRLNAAILSLDSLCVYRGIDIASAKPTPAERAAITHFGIDLIAPDEHFCAGDFAREFARASRWCAEQGKNLIIAGGSGFYLNALLAPLAPKVPALAPFADRDTLWAQVCQIDPPFAQKFSKNDTFRLQKWHEIRQFTRAQPSAWLRENSRPPVLAGLPIFSLGWDVGALRGRIAARTEAMFAAGMLDEARRLFRAYPQGAKALESIGLKECGEFLRARGEVCAWGECGGDLRGESGANLRENMVANSNLGVGGASNLNSNLGGANGAKSNLRGADFDEKSLTELKNLITTHTAQLAKRQRTFNKKAFAGAVQLPASEANFWGLADEIERFLRRNHAGELY